MSSSLTKSQKTFYIYTFGCSRRYLDAIKLVRFFEKNGWKITPDPLRSDLIILNTCALTKGSEEYVLELMAKYQKMSKKLVVCGCAPKVMSKQLKKYPLKNTFTPANFDHIDQVFKNLKYSINQIADGNVLTYDILADETKAFVDKLSRQKNFLQKVSDRLSRRKSDPFYLRISNGCNFRCSYCAINQAVGPLKSKPLKTCLLEFDQGLKLGYTNFIVTAEDVGGYGTDIHLTFPQLLEKMINSHPRQKFKIYIQELNPVWLLKYQTEFCRLVKSKKIIRILCPIQSGSDRIIKKMNRGYYDTQKVILAFRALKSAYPQLELETHLITGFPGETNQDFAQSLEFVKQAGIKNVAVFPYDEKENVASAAFLPKISSPVINSRMEQARVFFNQNQIRLIDPDFWIFPSF